MYKGWKIRFGAFKKKFDQESIHLFKNSSWVTLSNALGTGYAFIKTIAITRILGVELFGAYALAIAFVVTTQEFFRLNISMGLIRFGAIFHKEERKDKIVSAIKFSLFLSCFSALVSILVLAIIASVSYDTFIKQPNLLPYIIGFAFANSLGFVDAIAKAALKLFFKFKMNSIMQMMMDSLELIIVLSTLFIFGADLQAFFIAAICARMLNSIVCNVFAYQELRRELKPYLASPARNIRNHYKEFIQYIFGNSLSSSLKVFMNQGDLLLLGQLSTVYQAGLYSTAKKLAYAVLTLTDPLASSIFPQLSHLIAGKDTAKINVMIKKITLWMLLPCVLIFSVCLLFDKEIIVLLFGPAYMEAHTAFLILLVCSLQGVLSFWALPLIQSLGLIRKRFMVYISAIIIGGLTAWLCIPYFGAAGAAIGLLSANLYISVKFVRAGIARLHSTTP